MLFVPECGTTALGSVPPGGNGLAERRLTELRKSNFMDPEYLVSNEKGPALGESSWFKLLPQV